MSKKTATLLIVLLILLIAGGFVGFYLFLNKGAVPEAEPTPSPSGPSDFFPFPDNPDSPSPTPPSGTTPSPTGPAATPPPFNQSSNLIKLSNEPVAGATFVERENGSRIRYIERKVLPRIYEANLSPLQQTRLANTDIRKVLYEALWTERGVGVVLRYLKDDLQTIESFYGKLVSMDGTATSSLLGASNVAASDSMELTATFLPQNTVAVATSPKQDRIFYLSENNGGVIGVVSTPDGAKKSTVFDSPVSEWLVAWPKEDTISLQSKASSEVKGYFYALNLKNNISQTILAGVNGLTALMDPTGEYVLYAGSSGQSAVTSVYTVKTGQTATLDTKTLPEKCVWSVRSVRTVFCGVPKTFEAGIYPDSWYQGKISFDDKILKIDLATGASELVADLSTIAREPLDAIELQLNATENKLLFKNKRDRTAWVLMLE